MENKIFSILAIGIVISSIIISFCTNCYISFMEGKNPLTHINKRHSVINITGY